MNGMKFNLSIIFAIVLQGVALTWFLANQNAKIETLYSEFEQQNKKEIIEHQVKMKLDLENIIKVVAELKRDMKKLKSKDKVIMEQHDDIFKLLQDSTNSVPNNYSYGN